MSDNQIMEATDGFACEIDGERFIVNRTTTRVRADHKLVQQYPNMFRPVEDGLTYRDDATATADPGMPRPARTARKPITTEAAASKE